MNDNASLGLAASKPGALQESRGRHLARAALIGVIAGLLAVAFKWALAGADGARVLVLKELHASGSPAACLVLPAVGLVVGCLIGWMVRRYAPDASGSGIPHIKGVLLHVRELRWGRLIPIKFVAGVLGVGVGLSLGREGPTVQMGAAVGRGVCAVAGIRSRSVPQLVSCGAGAGLAAAFNAPLAGFLFVIEELHRELSARTFGGALVAALSSVVVARALGGDLPSFEISGYPSLPLGALPLAAMLGMVGGAIGVVLNRGLIRTADVFAGVRVIPPWLATGLVCAVCGLVAWWIPEAVGAGHSTAERLLNGSMSAAAGWGAGALALLLVVKFVLVLVSYATGAPGGVFAPMLLIGALVGTILARGVEVFFPNSGGLSTALAILGMASVFTGSIRAPLTGMVLIIELTGDYDQLLALGVACILADLTAARLAGEPLYDALLAQDLRRLPAGSNAPQSLAEPRGVFIGVQRGSEMEGRAIGMCGLPPGCIVVAMERSGREIHPEADVILLPGDHLTVIVPSDEPARALEISRLATGI